MKFVEYTETPSIYHNGDKSKHYTFHIGPQELIILRDMLDHFHKTTPRSLFTQPFTSRMGAMRSEVHKVIRSHNVQMPPRPKWGNSENPPETF